MGLEEKRVVKEVNVGGGLTSLQAEAMKLGLVTWPDI